MAAANFGMITDNSVALVGLLAGENTMAVRLRNVTLLADSVLTKCNQDLLIRPVFNWQEVENFRLSRPTS
jgi:hypothetical protein